MQPRSPSPRRPSSRLRRAALTPCLCLLSALSLAACQRNDPSPQLAVEKPVLVQRQAPADLTAKCARQPDRPASFVTINALLGWVEKALYAGSACRALSDKQGQWIGSPPT